MLKTKNLNKLLSRNTSPHVSSALIFTPSGNLIAYSSPTASAASTRTQRMQTSIAANIWSSYARVASDGLIEESLGIEIDRPRPPTPSPKPLGSTENDTEADKARRVEAWSPPPVDRPVALTFELSDSNIYIQQIRPRLLLCLIGPKQPSAQASARSSVHSTENLPSGSVGADSKRSGSSGKGSTTEGASRMSDAGALGVLKTQAKALAEYIDEHLEGFEMPAEPL